MLIDPGSFGMFLVAAIVLAFIPGPSVLYVLARTLAGGKQEGISSTFGTSIGGLLHVILAATGLTALLAASAHAFAIVKFIGAAYLIGLGVKMIWSATQATFQELRPGVTNGAKRAFSDGILTEAFNVKTALFFLAFIPQFLNHTLPVAPQIIVYGLICVFLNTLVDLIVVSCAVWLTPLVKGSATPAKLMSFGSGSVLVGLGIYLGLGDSMSP
ncbi:LysE family translocator [Methylobacillus methanolivorans]|uniref:LysE family translocator n=1 Tax=Methylobacillus methanolivorans TaxID=1848927 RepID=A0ABW8GLN4_9PROT